MLPEAAAGTGFHARVTKNRSNAQPDSRVTLRVNDIKYASGTRPLANSSLKFMTSHHLPRFAFGVIKNDARSIKKLLRPGIRHEP
jgi:hypothetical protein